MRVVTDEIIFSALETYQQMAWNKEGIPPSGADMVAQFTGGVCYFNPKQKQIMSFTWGFTDMEFCLLHTGQKLATHEHLKKIKEINFDGFEKILNAGFASLKNKNSAVFAKAIHAYGELLAEKKLVAVHTKKLLEKIYQQPGVLAAKGCGAMGSDVVLVLLEKLSTNTFTEWVERQGLRVMAAGCETSEGFYCYES